MNEWNRSLGGDIVEVDFWIEHVLPEKPESGWEAFSPGEHSALKDCLANLLPLTQKMNQELSNGPYAVKRKVYEEDSCFKGARDFAKAFITWTPTEIKLRSEALSDWVVKRWKY